jgi:hypothetical protein
MDPTSVWLATALPTSWAAAVIRSTLVHVANRTLEHGVTGHPTHVLERHHQWTANAISFCMFDRAICRTT